MIISKKFINTTLASLLLGVSTFFTLVALVSTLAFAQFPTSQTTVTPTATPSPTLAVSPLTGGTTQSTSPAAGNALPTIALLAGALALLSAGIFSLKIKSSRTV